MKKIKWFVFLTEFICCYTNVLYSQNIVASKTIKSDPQTTLKYYHQIKANQLSTLYARFKTPVVIDKINPWEKITNTYNPIGKDDTNFNLITTIGGVRYSAFVVTNLSDKNISFKCDIINTVQHANVFQLYKVLLVNSGAQSEEVADPLIPTNKNINLASGESQMFFFKVVGEKPGKSKITIHITSSVYSSALNVNVNTLNISFNKEKYSLNTVNWAYFGNAMLKDRTDEVIADLLDHHINNIVIPPYAIPTIGNSNFKIYTDYISKLKPFTNLILFLNLKSDDYKESFNKVPFMSILWKENFTKWYNNILICSKSAGFSLSNVYLYPYDEISNDDIDRCYDFLSWLRSNFPQVKTFGTFTTTSAAKRLTTSLTISDILNNSSLINFQTQNNYNNLWIYDTQSGSEALSAYGYYRLMAWRAFNYNLKGIGFWNYTDYKNESTNGIARVDDFNSKNASNYSVIYNGPGKQIFSSRRWEGFKLGVEDYELLKLYAQKNGVEKTRLLAASVINSPDNIDKADEVRNQMLISLSKTLFR